MLFVDVGGCVLAMARRPMMRRRTTEQKPKNDGIRHLKKYVVALFRLSHNFRLHENKIEKTAAVLAECFLKEN